MASSQGVLSLPSGPRLETSIPGRGNKAWNLEHQNSIVDDLLFEIYDRWHDARHDSFESDTFTECSSTEAFHWRRTSVHSDTNFNSNSGRLHQASLESQSLEQLKKLLSELQHRTNFMSSRLVRQLKRRERRQNKLQHNCDIITAILQAASQKRRIDTRLRFSLEPPPGDSAFEQWKDAMQAVARLPLGIPDGFRKKVWLSLAENHIRDLRIDWERTVRFVFNERSNPDDNTLGLQIVKDLHRTGCFGQDNEEDRAVLKRVLLAYARWNKTVGYCQGFNVIAALLLEVMERKEDDALMVMIYLIDYVLPDSYFANNLRALSVDMAVFRDLLGLMFPKLSKHLDFLQYAAQDQSTGPSYEPPLTNVFTMQWFLTMFATCLPKDVVLRVWDSVLLEGSEILLRTALAIWGKLSRRILSVGSADEFYSLMGVLTQDTVEGRMFDADALIKFIYSCAPFPMQQLPELREKYTYNIRPFSSAGGSKKANVVGGMVLPSDDDDLDEEDLEAITCFTGILPRQLGPNKSKGMEGDMSSSFPDISALGPGAYGANPESNVLGASNLYLERMTTDISSLKKQYHRLKQRQAQAHIILAAASAKQHAKPKIIVPKIEMPKAMNHLFVGKSGTGVKKRLVADSPIITTGYPQATLVHHYLQEVKKQKSPGHKAKKTSDIFPTSKNSVVERTSSVGSVGSVCKQSDLESSIDFRESVDEQLIIKSINSLDCTISEASDQQCDTVQENSNTCLTSAVNKHSADESVDPRCVDMELCNSELCSDVKISSECDCKSNLNDREMADSDLKNSILSLKRETNSQKESSTKFNTLSSAEGSLCQVVADSVTPGNDSSLEQVNADIVPKNCLPNDENCDKETTSTYSSTECCGNPDSSASQIGCDSSVHIFAQVNEELELFGSGENHRMLQSQNHEPESQEDESTIIDTELTVLTCSVGENESEYSETSPDFSVQSSPNKTCQEGCDISVDKQGDDVKSFDSVAPSEKNNKEEPKGQPNGMTVEIVDESEFQVARQIDSKCTLLPCQNLCSSCSDINIQSASLSKKDINEDLNRMESLSDSELSSIVSLQDSSELSKNLTDSDSCSVFSPESISERCFSYSERSESDRSLSQTSQDSSLSSHAFSENRLKKGTQRSSESGTTGQALTKRLQKHSNNSTSLTNKDATLSNQAINEHLGNYSKSKSALASAKSAKPFSPFPVKHFNENRARTGLKLGMYKVGTIAQLEKQTKRKALWSK